MPNAPYVSILTPIYNTNPTHLKECINSILNQTFSDFEFLLLNDSPENTELEKIVASYQDRRITYLKNDENLGISASRNKLLKLAKGKYIAILDHDDISAPTRLEKQVRILDLNPDIGLVGSGIEVLDMKKSIGGGARRKIVMPPELNIDIQIELTKHCCIAHTASMIRKSVLLDNHIEYEGFYTPAEDYRLFSRLMPLTKFYNIQEPLVTYRIHSTSTSSYQTTQMHNSYKEIATQIRNQFPAYYQALLRSKHSGSFFRLRLFGVIPFLKVKNNTIYLLEFIPLFKIIWRG